MAIIGAILGDIAGSRWEFRRPKDLDWEHIDLFADDCILENLREKYFRTMSWDLVK